MPKIVEVPGLGEVEFPDNMSNEEIETAIQKDLSQRQQVESLNPPRNIGDLPGDVIEGAKSAIGQIASQIPLRILAPEEGYDPSGIQDFGLRAALSRADTPAEVETQLIQRVGPDGYVRTPRGRIAITPMGQARLGIRPQKDRPVILDEGHLTFGDIADVSAEIPGFAGALAAGSITGGAASIPALIGRMALVGAGAAIGKAGQEGAEQALGENIQPFGEVAKDVAIEGGVAAAGEGIFGVVLSPLGKKIIAPQAKLVTKESLELAETSRGLGFKPSAFQIAKAGDRPTLVGRAQAIANRIFGDPVAEHNSRQINVLMGKLRRSAGKKLVGADVGEAIQEDIKAVRKSISAWADDAYTKVDQAIGNEAVIPTSGIKRQAAEILDALPQSAETGAPVFTAAETSSALRQVSELPEFVTSSQMQAVRTRLREALGSPEILPGVSKHNIRLLKDAANQSFDDAVTKGTISPEARELLQVADTEYAKRISQLDKSIIQRITKDPSAAGAIPPEQIVDVIFKKNNETNIKRIMGLVQPETQEAIRREAMDTVLRKMVSRTDDPLVNVFNGRNFLNALDNIGNVPPGSVSNPTLEAMFGKELTKDMYEFGKVVSFVTQKPDATGALVAAGIATKPWQNVKRLIKFKALSKLLTSKTGLKWATEGFKAPKTRAGAQALARFATQLDLLVTKQSYLPDLLRPRKTAVEKFENTEWQRFGQ